MIKLFSLETGYKSIEVFKSFHTLENRNKDTLHHRDHNLHKEDYKAIFKEAIKNGLISYRGKGHVVIEFKDSENTKYSILAEVAETINIVTVYYNKKSISANNFITCNQRIRLTNYVLDLSGELKETIFIRPKVKLKTSKNIRKVQKVKKVEKLKKVQPSLDNYEISEEEKQMFFKNIDSLNKL